MTVVAIVVALFFAAIIIATWSGGRGGRSSAEPLETWSTWSMVDVVGTQRSHSRRGRRGPWSTWSERSLTDRRSDAVWRFDRRPSGVVGLSRCPNRWMLHGRLTYDLGGSLDGSDGTLSSSFDGGPTPHLCLRRSSRRSCRRRRALSSRTRLQYLL